MNAASSSTLAPPGKGKKKSIIKHPSLMDDPASARLRITHIAGLRRLSERANSGSPRHHQSSSSGSSSKVSLSFSGLGQEIIRHLQSCGVRIDPGLTEQELDRIEATLRFTFPPDLRGILQQGLPLGSGFPDWRSGLGSQKLRLWISAPKSELCSAAEEGRFWWRSWGAAPTGDSVRAARGARAALRAVPPLVPLYGRCYVPAAPSRAGNPVFFLAGADVGAVEASSESRFYCARDVGEFFRGFISGGDGSECFYSPEPIDASSSCSRRIVISRCRSSVGDDEICRSSSVSARSVLTGGRVSSRSSDGSSDDASAGGAAASGGLIARRIRRIEFWSDLIEKGPAMNSAGEEGFVELHQQRECCCGEEQGGDVWEAVRTSVAEIGQKLRSAGWDEKDVGEIVESVESSSLDKKKNKELDVSGRVDRQSVLEGLATQLDVLSSCLREAGWSLNDITESLCLDLSGFSEPASARSVRKLSPEVASRIGVLAAFVAQG